MYFWNFSPFVVAKGQLISKCPFGVIVSTKIPTKKFDFTTCRLVFICLLEESEDTKKTF